MTQALAAVAALGGLVAFAAGLLWVIESVARSIGSRNTWLTFLVYLPALIGAIIGVVNWGELAWWQVIVLPIVAPMAVALVLVVCFAMINPFDSIALVGGMITKGWQRLRKKWLAGNDV